LSGVENVAVASTLSFLVGLLVAMYFVHGYKKIGFQSGGEACVKQQYSFTAFMRQTLKIGVPATMEPMSYELNRFFITIVVIGLGTLAVSTRIYSLNLILVPVIFSQAIGVGNRILVSYLLGKGDAAAIEAQIKESIKASVLGSSAMLLLIWFFSDYAFGIFTDAEDILALGAVLIGIDMLRHPAGATNMVVVNSLVVAGDVRYPVVISIASMWLICLPLVYVFGVVLEYGLYGVWIALLLDEYFRCIMILGRWSARRWQRMSMLPTS
ncbi:MATE family efflux transporter, partial [Photobacterium sanctipauli]